MPASSKPNTDISIRMYRQGLGDCFLLTFATGAKKFYMVIDCGVVLGTSDPEHQMTKVVTNLAGVTKHIDVLVVTHEHWDHVSGFTQVETLFKDFTVDQVWVAWTEDPHNALANKLRKERTAAEQALRMAAIHLTMAGEHDAADRVGSFMGFFGAKSGSTTDALNFAKKLAGDSGLRFCSPANPPITVPALPGIRFWVLGPPQDEKLLKKSNPGKGEGYGLDAAPGGAQSLLIAGLARALGATADGYSETEDCIENPFDAQYSISIAQASSLEFFQKHYFEQSADESLYQEPDQVSRDQSWRRIDNDWMAASESMALQLDSATNNTSLVLAIERTDTGEVFLFPGDAQAGNWLSWQNLKWEIGEKDDKKTVTGPELLARTVFYKVGHHGSHNATLQEKGLELMVNDSLIAMIPVDHDMAVKKHWGRMPLPDLVDRLREKTHGRILRIDDKAKDATSLAAQKQEGASDTEWKAFTDRVTVTELYYEITL